MDNANAIAVELNNITKTFILRHQSQDTIKGVFLRHILGTPSHESKIDALKDISFTVKQGELVGIIGKNGSGKSTLLRIILGILKPSSGDVQTHGRISGILDLVAGFHENLTGKENIFLNGTLFGLTRAELARVMDRIISFSGLGEFIDVPLRNYSTGMLLRLGFSLAVSVDPDILLVDEILMVGDIAFQRRCMEKLREFADAGKTILMVSHSLEDLRPICNRCLVLSEGRLLYDGITEDAFDVYLNMLSDQEKEGNLYKIRQELKQWESTLTEKIKRTDQMLGETERKWRYRFEQYKDELVRNITLANVEGKLNIPKIPGTYGNMRAHIHKVSLLDNEGSFIEKVQEKQPIRILIHFRLKEPVDKAIIGVSIHDSALMETLYTQYDIPASICNTTGAYYAYVGLPFSQVGSGKYYVSPVIKDGNSGEILHQLWLMHSFEVIGLEAKPADEHPVWSFEPSQE